MMKPTPISQPEPAGSLVWQANKHASSQVNLGQPRAKLKPRKAAQLVGAGHCQPSSGCPRQVATALLLIYLAPLICASKQQPHQTHQQVTKWPARQAFAGESELEWERASEWQRERDREVNATATGPKRDRNDDISMINEMVAQDADADAGKSGNWRPVDVDVGQEINQYGEDEPIGGAAPKVGPNREQTSGRKRQEVRDGAGAGRGTRSKRTASATTMEPQSDGSPQTQTEPGPDPEPKLEPAGSNKTGQDNLKCRLEKDWYMEFEQYKHYACANCYSLLPPELFTRKLIFRKELKGLMLDEGNRLLLPNETDLIKSTFRTERTFNFWQQCCQQAIDCCRRNSIYLPKARDPTSGHWIDDTQRGQVCPATWDGFSCWPESPAGLVAIHDCPLHVYFLEFMPICIGQVTKQCFANGSWYVKNGHEWSNYSKCNGLEVYIHRMMIGSGLHLFSVIVIGPALLILGKMRQRFGTRRVRILRWLLFWLLLNGLFSATQKIGIILGVFQNNQANERAPAEAPPAASRNQTSAGHLSGARTVRAAALPPHPNQQQPLVGGLVERSDSWMRRLDSSRSKYEKSEHEPPIGGRARRMLLGDQSASQSAQARDYPPKDQQSFLVVLICWTISVGIRITRLFGYAWMFTSAVYLCSVLHFSPAEPPPLFMNWLMFSTHAFPVVIGSIYVIVRSIYDPSPLTLLFQVPYHYVLGNTDHVNYLKDTQLDCWMVSSKIDRVEDIAGWPYLALVLLNTALFVITLIIMCRFKKLPGSTRPETSLWGYFKAAGMLVFLYGAHYLLLAYTPRVEGCTINQVWHYAMLLIDGIQGVAISLVFCYRTSAGKEVIWKWWNNLKEDHNCHCCARDVLCHRRRTRASHYQRGLLKQNSRTNRSTGSSNSTCNGKDMATELSNVNAANNF